MSDRISNDAGVHDALIALKAERDRYKAALEKINDHALLGLPCECGPIARAALSPAKEGEK